MTILERLNKNTIKNENGCWLWIGYKKNNGYGEISYKGKHISIHRLSAHLFLGLNLSNYKSNSNHKEICPNRNCWNPEHLYVGTASDNNHDTGKFGNHKRVNGFTYKTTCSKGHSFTGKNSRQRICYICKNESQRLRRMKVG